MPERLKSRKFWMTVLGLGAVIATEFFGVGNDVAQTITKAIEILVPVYVGSQGIVDGTFNLIKYLAQKGENG